MAEGIRVRHGRNCRSNDGGRCNCQKSYEAQVWSPRDGKKLRKSFPTEAAAKKWRADALGAVHRGTMRAPTGTTVREAVEAWEEGARNGTIRKKGGEIYKPSALATYVSAVRVPRKALAGPGGKPRSILDELGGRKLADVQRRDIQDIVDRLVAGGLNPSTIRNATMILRAVFRRALKRNEVAVNPTTALDMPASTGRRDRIASPDEATLLLGLLPRKTDRVFWAVAFYAGLRAGEILGLRWEDVDLASGLIHVRQAWDPRNKVFVAPKSKAGKRKVPILAVLRDFLLEHKLETGGETGLVFPNDDNRPLNYWSTIERARRAWERGERERQARVEEAEQLLKQPAGSVDADEREAAERVLQEDAEPIVRIGLHECRHTFASILIAAGVNAKAISTFLGHSSIQITFDLYGHLMPGAEDEAAALADAYLERAATQARLAQLDEPVAEPELDADELLVDEEQAA